MKITSQEEYGLRILIRVARCREPEGISIPRISEEEGLSTHYVAKLCRLLRLGGFIRSTRGKTGGYTLTRPAEEISLRQVLDSLGGRLYSGEFCDEHTGLKSTCIHSTNCAVRPLWTLIQNTLDQILENYTLKDIIEGKSEIPQKLSSNRTSNPEKITVQI